MKGMTKEREIEDEMFLTDDEEEDTQANKYLLFNIADEVYGIWIGNVKEIIEMQKITEVPDVPEYIKGVINLRGRVVPVMNLRVRFGMEEKPYDDRTCMIIVNIDNSSMGFIVDTVAEVHEIPGKDIEPPPNFRTDSERERYISGLGKVGDEVKILIDAKKVLQEKELKLIKNKIETK